MGPIRLTRARVSASTAHHARCLGLTLALLVGLVVVWPLASATLPDLLWVAGVYDGGDYDSVIALSADGGPSAASPVLDGAMPLVPWRWPTASRPHAARLRPLGSSRAPPLA